MKDPRNRDKVIKTVDFARSRGISGESKFRGLQHEGTGTHASAERRGVTVWLTGLPSAGKSTSVARSTSASGGDVKGLYKKALAGTLERFTGTSSFPGSSTRERGTSL